jgi:hypothetical protein
MDEEKLLKMQFNLHGRKPVVASRDILPIL